MLSDRVSDRVNAGDTLSDSGCRSLSIRQRMLEILYKTADAGDTLSTADTEESLSDSGGRSLSFRQRMQKSIRQLMQESLCQTADAEVSLSPSGCRRHSIRQLLHLMECLLHPLSD